MEHTSRMHHSLCLTLTALVTFGVPVRGQVAPSEPAAATAFVSLGARRTSLRNSGAWMVGGDARISFGTSFSLGAGGWALAKPLGISGVAGASDLELAISYAGLQAEYRLAQARVTGIGLRLLVGAGSAKVRLPIVGTELAADNFGVIEPEVVGELALRDFAQLRAQLGYRLVYGVEDLPQVGPEHLRGVTLTLSLLLESF